MLTVLFRAKKRMMGRLLPPATVPIVLLFFSCGPKNGPHLSVDIPVEGAKIVQLFNLSTVSESYRDTLRGTLSLDSLHYGIYLVTVMWNRDVISPDEFDALRPHTLDEQPYYSLQRAVFIDPKERGSIRLHIPAGMSRAQLEERLMDRNRPFSPSVEAQGKNARRYEAYESILDRCREDFCQRRDSLKALLYASNDRGDLQNSQRINLEINDLWEREIQPQYEMAEIRFLTEHVDSPIIPFILHHRITDRESYQSFKPIIDNLRERGKNLGFIRKWTEPEDLEI